MSSLHGGQVVPQLEQMIKAKMDPQLESKVDLSSEAGTALLIGLGLVDSGGIAGRGMGGGCRRGLLP